MDKLIWIKKKEDWLKGILINRGDKFLVEVNGEQFLVDQIETRNTDDIDNINNLISIPHLNVPSILNAINLRYNEDVIYTYTGAILISVNPFENLGLYNKSNIDKYHKKKGDLLPHIYQESENTYRLLKKRNQSILISGESGAGKTYCARNIMDYLANISGLNMDISEKIIASNPIMESFGNAKTLMNDNSSRFGKFIKLQYQDTDLIGAKIDTYLLEKIRVIKQNDGERNFHIFYQFLSGLSPEKKIEYNLKNIEDYRILNRRYIERDDGVIDKDEFDTMVKSFELLGFEDVLVEKIFRIIAAILNISNNEDIEISSKLLEIDKNILTEALFFRNLYVDQKNIHIELSENEKLIANDSLCMKLYQDMFTMIVSNINTLLDNDGNKYIGILDIFGFECFEENSFEQYCINFTNETLQQQFNKHIFKLEQEEYRREKIRWEDIEFPDNQECLDLEKNVYIELDEESRLKACDKRFTNKIIKKFANNPYFHKERIAEDTHFSITHYAGKINYKTVNFCKKNLDIISNEILNCTIHIFGEDCATGKPVSRISSKTISQQFQSQLKELMKVISLTYPHYIRCIKPNEESIKKKFNRIKVLDQLRYSGVLEAIRVARSGYPDRFTKESFRIHYRALGCDIDTILENINKTDYQIGITKIFLKNGAYESLEQINDKFLSLHAVNIQKIYRGFIAKREYLHKLLLIIKIQSIFRMKIAINQKMVLKRNRNAILIQKYIRCYKHYHKYRHIYKSILSIQKCYRAYKYRCYLRLVILIQKRIKRRYLLKYDSVSKIIRQYRKYRLSRRVSSIIKIQRFVRKSITSRKKIIARNKELEVLFKQEKGRMELLKVEKEVQSLILSEKVMLIEAEKQKIEEDLLSVLNEEKEKRKKIEMEKKTQEIELLEQIRIEKEKRIATEKRLKLEIILDNKKQKANKEIKVKINKMEEDISLYRNWVKEHVDSQVALVDQLNELQKENEKLSMKIKNNKKKKRKGLWDFLFG